MSDRRYPPVLAPGAKVALVAPSGPIRDGDVERATANVTRLGFEPVLGAHAQDRMGYLAGRDADRLADLNWAIHDRAVAAVWCIRGGYGCTRLLHGVDYAAWTRTPKPLIGFSDVSALHAAIGERANLVTFHGPTARGTLTPFARRSLQRALMMEGSDPLETPAANAAVVRPGVAVGRLAGGNLAVLTALCGTPFMPDLDGAILVLEDVNEAVYRTDRLLIQLRSSGALDAIAGLGFGQFTDIPTDASTGGERPLADVFAETAEALGVPCLSGLPVGHVDDQWTLPLGAMAELDAEGATLRVIQITRA